MDDSTFNLIDEPWIGVIYQDGNHHDISLQELLRDMTDIRELRMELPTMSFAALRMLIAIVGRAFYRQLGDMWGPELWAEAYGDPELTAEYIGKYLEHFRDRFNLFDKERPFYQVADLENSGKVSLTLDKLIGDVPNGDLFFSMRQEDGLKEVSFSEAARWLLHVQCYDPSGIRPAAKGDSLAKSGKGYPVGTGWAGQLGGVHLRGKNLFETVMLNLIPLADDGEGERLKEITGLRGVVAAEDIPAWERNERWSSMRGEVVPRGVCQTMTYQSRRVRLFPQGDKVVGVMVCQGDKLTPQNRQGIEPMTAWRFSKPQSDKSNIWTYMPRKQGVEQAMWRGLPSIVPQLSGMVEYKKQDVIQFEVPAIVRWHEYLVSKGLLDYRPLVDICGVTVHYGTQEATVQDILADSLSLPTELFERDNSVALAKLEKALKATQEVSVTLQILAKKCIEATGGTGKDVSKYYAKTIDSDFYYRIDTAMRRWLRGLGSVEKPLEEWKGELKKNGLAMRDEIVERVNVYAWQSEKSLGDAIGSFDRFFYGTLKGLNDDIPNQTTGRSEQDGISA